MLARATGDGEELAALLAIRDDLRDTYAEARRDLRNPAAYTRFRVLVDPYWVRVNLALDKMGVSKEPVPA